MKNKKKSLLTLAIAILVAVVGVVSTAYADNSSWIPQNIQKGPSWHEVTYLDSSPLKWNYSVLQAGKPDGMHLCKSTSDAQCTGYGYTYNSILKVCQSATDMDCIVSVKAVDSSGTSTDGTFSNYSVTNHVNFYPADTKLGIPEGDMPSIWNISGASHASGSDYALIVGKSGWVNSDGSTDQRGSFLAASITPVHKIQYQGGGDPKINTPYDSCIGGILQGNQVNIGCNTRSTQCLLTTNDGTQCYASEDFPTGIKFSLDLRLSREPTGWLHGRMNNPDISIVKGSNGSIDLIVSAGSMSVPELYQGADWNSLSPEMQNFWVECMTNGEMCGIVRGNGVNNDNMPYQDGVRLSNHALMHLEGSVYSFGKVAMDGVTAASPLVGNKASAMTTAWSFRTLSNEEMNGADKCFTSTPGIKGIVTTNSIAYSAGPPALSAGSLNYQVASPHYMPDGASPFKGVYNLVMRSDTARCIYGFSSAPISASISVLSSDGANDVATTVAGEKNGWLSLSANNFQFSSPVIKVKLTQAGSSGTKSSAPAPKPTKAPAKKK